MKLQVWLINFSLPTDERFGFYLQLIVAIFHYDSSLKYSVFFRIWNSFIIIAYIKQLATVHMVSKACWVIIKNIVTQCSECVILIFWPWIHNAVISLCYQFTPRAFGVGDTNCSQSICYYIRPFRSAQGSLKILTNKQMNHKFKKINK